ncbi:MAG TPA: hypothetical protein PKE03_03315 [Bacteroidales bacterium]|nr:hypothetical protein [Bacteroidales bacterium]
MAYVFRKFCRPIPALPLLISLLLLAAAACNRKTTEQAPAAFDEAKAQASDLLKQLEVLDNDDIMQLEVRAGRLTLDQRVLDNKAAEESLRTTLEFLSHLSDDLEGVRNEVSTSLGRFDTLRNSWLNEKDNRPLIMEQFFLEQRKLNDLVMQADYLVSRWNAQLMNIEAFEQAFPQNQDE